MKITKQLFEDALSGKLKGTFKLKNGFTVRSNRLFESNSMNSYIYALRGFSTSFTALGKSSSAGYYDIIDFIPDKNMKENELTIEIPNGKIVDWEESKKQNKIILKYKQLTYEDICKKLINGKNFYYICGNGAISSSAGADTTRFLSDINNATTRHQLECILAKNQLANVAVYLNDGWKPSCDSDIFLLIETQEGILTFGDANGSCASNCGSIWFKSKELAQQAIEILGVETIKLALEPLGI